MNQIYAPHDARIIQHVSHPFLSVLMESIILKRSVRIMGAHSEAPLTGLVNKIEREDGSGFCFNIYLSVKGSYKDNSIFIDTRNGYLCVLV